LRGSAVFAGKREPLVWGLLALLAVLAMREVGLFEGQRLLRGLSNLAVFARDMVPPDVGVLPLAGRALWETVVMAFAGTALGFVLSLPLGMMGARTVSPLPLVAVARLVVAVARTIPRCCGQCCSSSWWGWGRWRAPWVWPYTAWVTWGRYIPSCSRGWTLRYWKRCAVWGRGGYIWRGSPSGPRAPTPL